MSAALLVPVQKTLPLGLTFQRLAPLRWPEKPPDASRTCGLDFCHHIEADDWLADAQVEVLAGEVRPLWVARCAGTQVFVRLGGGMPQSTARFLVQVHTHKGGSLSCEVLLPIGRGPALAPRYGPYLLTTRLGDPEPLMSGSAPLLTHHDRPLYGRFFIMNPLAPDALQAGPRAVLVNESGDAFVTGQL